jgi:hypothetical protein
VQHSGSIAGGLIRLKETAGVSFMVDLSGRCFPNERIVRTMAGTVYGLFLQTEELPDPVEQFA